jgi:hypothetical protein
MAVAAGGALVAAGHRRPAARGGWKSGLGLEEVVAVYIYIYFFCFLTNYFITNK